MKKKRFAALFTVSSVIFVFLLAGCTLSHIRNIEARWNISLPRGKEVYYKVNWGWFGDGEAYSVYSLTSEPDEKFYAQFESVLPKRETEWFEQYEKEILGIAEMLEVPASLCDFSKDYIALPPSYDEENFEKTHYINLYGAHIFYFPEEQRLVIAEWRS